MVNNKRLHEVFMSLADPTRRAILEQISREPMTVSAVAEPFSMSLPAVVKHLHVLEGASLIRKTRRGRKTYISLNPAPLRDAAEYVALYARFWDQKLDQLEVYLKRKEVTKHGK